MPDVRRLCLIAVIAISPLVIVASFGGCGSSGNADGGSDATTSPDTNDNDAGNTMMCSCPAADAALFNPNGTTCCAGSSCVAQHTDGFSHTFYDCYGVFSWVTPLALDACRAYFDAATPCAAATCGMSEVVEGTGSACVTWTYQGNDIDAIGHVRAGKDGGPCECPDGGDPSWY
jgi:hypothetical protein